MRPTAAARVGRDPLAGKEQLQGVGPPQLRQADDRDDGGHHSDAHLGEPEPGLLGRQPTDRRRRPGPPHLPGSGPAMRATTGLGES